MIRIAGDALEKALIEKLILDFHEQAKEGLLPQPVPREERLSFISRKVDTVIGVRRGGKTWFLFQIMRELAPRIPWERILYLNFEDERLYSLKMQDLHLIEETFYELYPQSAEELCYFFFDEIQNVTGWERYVRRLIDTGQIQVVITGSSARLLGQEISTSLRGRSLPTEIYPLSFREFLRFHGVKPPMRRELGLKTRAKLSALFKKFLLIGGFPEVQNLSEMDRLRVLQEYFRSIMYRDIVERYNIRQIIPLKNFMLYLISSVGKQFTVNRVYQHLRSLQIKVDKNQLYNYLNYLKDAYFCFVLEIFSKSPRVRQINPSKIYLIDTGLWLALKPGVDPDWGILLENFVFLELKRRHFQLFYYRTKTRKEIDLVTISETTGKRALIQVVFEVSQKETFEREISALFEASEETGITDLFLINAHEEKSFIQSNMRIRLVPAWKFGLMPEEILLES